MDESQKPLTQDHAHHWRIDEPNGKTSTAVCKYCGAEKEEKNGFVSTGNEQIVLPRSKFIGSQPGRRNY